MIAPHNFRGLVNQIWEDWHAHGRDWTKPGFRTIAVHRFGVFRKSLKYRLVRWPCGLLYNAMYRYCRNVYGIELPSEASVGHGVVIEHQGGIVIHGSTIIGDRCIIRHGCTMGIRRMSDLCAAPHLGDDVHLGVGAVLIGNITIGDGAQIGANAVVTKDVPAHAKAIGVPAVIYEEQVAMRWMFELNEQKLKN